jgi:excisionase family DNA binding protein
MMAITMSAKRARTIKQFCADYGVGRTFTYAEIKAGRLRAVKAGDRTLILQADSDAWARSLPKLTPGAAIGESTP